MSRETECRNRIDYLTKTFHATPNEVICDILCDIALSLAQIADKIGCDYEERKEFVADNATQASLVTVYHRRERE